MMGTFTLNSLCVCRDSSHFETKWCLSLLSLPYCRFFFIFYLCITFKKCFDSECGMVSGAVRAGSGDPELCLSYSIQAWATTKPVMQ